MPKLNFQMRTLQLLDVIAKGADTAGNIASKVGITHQSVGTQLLKYTHRDWVERKLGTPSGGRGRLPYVYEITGQGRDKLDFLKQVKSVMESQGVDYDEAKEIVLP